MTSADQQQRWASEREARGLTRGDASFARSGLMAMLDEPRLLVAVLPADPLSSAVDFDDDLLNALPQRFSGRTANGVQLLDSTIVTDVALGRFARGEGGWRAYVAIQRSGGVEVGIGETIRYRGRRNDTEAPHIYRLHYIVHAIRVAIESQGRALSARLPVEGPFELVVALSDTQRSLLGGLADGWDGPDSWLEGNACATSEVLIRSHVDNWPIENDEQARLLTSVSDRVCNAWGTTQRLFVPPHGSANAGRLLTSYA